MKKMTFGHFAQETSIPMKPITQDELKPGTDPTQYRWKKGILGFIVNNLVTFLIGVVFVIPLFKFGTI